MAVVVGSVYSAAAHAHAGHEPMTGFGSGILHPITGLDHLAAALAIGALSARQAGRATWALPLAFLGVMAATAFAGASGLAVGGAELGALASVFLTGALLVAGRRRPTFILACVCVLAAAMHGYLHGAEATPSESGMFLAGVMLTTVSLLGVGGLIGRVGRFKPGTRVAGVVMAVAALAVGVGG